VQKTRLILTLLAGASSLWAQSVDDRIKELDEKVGELDQRIKVDDRKTELKQEEDAAKAKTGASVAADPSGFTIRAHDGDYLLKLGFDLQVDNRSFVGPAGTALPDTILLRRARPVISGTVYEYVDFYFRPDFGLGTTTIYDAYVQVNYFRRATLRAGKFKPPVGLERLQGDDDTNFIERGLPTLLVPSRDIGFQLAGDLATQRVTYAVGVFNGVPDNGLSDGASSDHRDFAARLLLTPFQPDENNPLRVLGVGVGATTGAVDNIALPSYKSFGQNPFVAFASGVTPAGHRTRLAPQAFYYFGALGILAEYGLTEEGFQKGAVRRDIAFRAWQVQASYVLTGERKGFLSPAPRKNFEPRNRAWGAVELAARVGDFNAERGLYNYGFASPASAARRAHEWAGGVNWYLNRSLRLSLDCGRTNFLGGAVTGNRPSEKVILSRVQINFQ